MAPGQQSPSPSPIKRPSYSDRNSSAHSLSSSGKQLKVHRPHIVGQRRNTSYGKNLNKLPKINSTQALTAEGIGGNHQRKRSGPSTTSPATSPKINVNKRNSSYVSLKKNNSHTALKKNHSATALARNHSAAHLKRGGLAPLTPARPQKEKQVGFQFGNGEASSDDDEEEAEWEDSSHSPETTRQNSAYSTHPPTPIDGQSTNPQKRHSSPPPPSLKAQHRSAPLLTKHATERSQNQRPPDPALLQHNPRATRAPPAMSTVSAIATRSQTNLRDAADSKAAVNGHTSKSIPSGVSTSTPTDQGVSHFLSTTGSSGKSPRLGLDPREVGNDGLEDDTPSSFLPNYHPRTDRDRTSIPKSSSGSLSHSQSRLQPTLNPLTHHINNRSESPVFSRTQQRLELQRRETMRTPPGPAPPSTSPPTTAGSGGAPGGLGLPSPHDSTLQIMNMTRPGSARNRTRGVDGIDALDAKARKKEFDSATRQLNVVRRFRNPVAESVIRLQGLGLLDNKRQNSGGGVGGVSGGGGGKKGKAKAGIAEAEAGAVRPPSRAGPIVANGSKRLNGGAIGGVGPALNGKVAISRSLEERERERERERRHNKPHHHSSVDGHGHGHGHVGFVESASTRPTSSSSRGGAGAGAGTGTGAGIGNRQRVRFQPQRRGSHDDIQYGYGGGYGLGSTTGRGNADGVGAETEDELEGDGQEEEEEEDEGVGMGVTSTSASAADGGRRSRRRSERQGKRHGRDGSGSGSGGGEKDNEQELLRRVWGARVWVG